MGRVCGGGLEGRVGRGANGCRRVAGAWTWTKIYRACWKCELL